MRRADLRSVGERLTRVRGQRSQAEFSKLVGLHKNTLGTYERGEREIGAEALASLVEHGVNVNWLLSGEGPMLLVDVGYQVSEEGARYDPSQPLGLDTQRLLDAIAAVEEGLASIQRVLPPEKKAELIQLAYELLTEEDPEARADERTKVMRLIRAAA